MSSPEQDIVIDPAIKRRRRRRWILAAFVLLFLASVILGPPLINGERYRRRIATSMSEALGRPVHIDKVSFHLLPAPGITLGGLVVEENPAFGNEPVIRANVVEASLRLSSLWRRRFEVSSVKFETDENGSGASLNIVRNAQGRWNLQDILVQASHVNAAPTGQRKPGDTPRFPYIEAVGARVNLKLDNEKMPFSLTDADFALWLPSPQAWHLRLKAKPARTDTNATDTGTMSLEGTLGRSATLADVPIDLAMSWAHVPMGEATRVMIGEDQDWRGTLEAGVDLIGTVGNTHLTGNAHVTGLRRSDFVPAEPLDISTHCTATMNLTIVTATDAQCTIPNGGPKPITVSSPSLDMQRPGQSDITISISELPLDWVMLWAHLFSPHIPQTLPVGTINGEFQQAATNGQWSGAMQVAVDSVQHVDSAKELAIKPFILGFTAEPGTAFELQPAVVQWTNASQITLSGSADANHYALHVAGSATPDQIRALGNDMVTPFGSDLTTMMKGNQISVSCTRPFSGEQTCTADKVQPAPKKHKTRR
jgi:hypothetical protein